MTTAKNQRVTDLRVLKTVQHERLLNLLSPHQRYFATRGLILRTHGKITDDEFKQLGAILKTPDHDTPVELVHLVHMVNELAREATMESLLDQIDGLADAFNLDERVTPADVAVEAILNHRDRAELIHRRQLLDARRTYSYFQANAELVPQLDDRLDMRRALFENHAGAYFEAKRCGHGTQAVMQADDETLAITVSHGLPWRLQDILVDGARDILKFQPLHDDCLQFNRITGELKINALTEIQKEMYRAAFGQHFFDDPNLFPAGDIWTAQPLRINGDAALSVVNVPELLSAALTSVSLFIAGVKPELVTTKRVDLIDVLEERLSFYDSQGIEARIAEARIELRFVDNRRPRSVTIKPPNIAAYTRDGDADVIEAFLKDRGFTNGQGIDPFKLPGTVLVGGRVGA